MPDPAYFVGPASETGIDEDDQWAPDIAIGGGAMAGMTAWDGGDNYEPISHQGQWGMPDGDEAQALEDEEREESVRRLSSLDAIRRSYERTQQGRAPSPHGDWPARYDLDVWIDGKGDTHEPATMTLRHARNTLDYIVRNYGEAARQCRIARALKERIDWEERQTDLPTEKVVDWTATGGRGMRYPDEPTFQEERDLDKALRERPHGHTLSDWSI